MEIRRTGNFGFIDTGEGQLISFAMGKGWAPSSINFSRPDSWQTKKIRVNGIDIVPMGTNNDLPGDVQRLLDNFYGGEGIMGKIQGLQWGEGPRFFEDAIDEGNNKFYRKWILDDKIQEDLERWDHREFMLRSLVDLIHMQGFWTKFIRNRGPRIGAAGKFLKLEHIPYKKCRFEYPGDNHDFPQNVYVGDWPFPDPTKLAKYPVFNPADPFKYPVSVGYFNIYSFCKDFVSTPRFLGAFPWLELAGTIAPLLAAYNANSSALSLHIESPQGYWDAAEERIKDICKRKGIAYSAKMLEDFKDEAMEKYAAGVTGRQNVGKYMHTTKFWNAEANNFEGWTITPIDKKIKDYIESQIKIANKADAAATSGFGLEPVLSNLIMENKLSSGSEKLYSIKVYNASETAIPDMILCKPLMHYIRANFPGSKTQIGLYRSIVNAEENISPSSRVKENA